MSQHSRRVLLGLTAGMMLMMAMPAAALAKHVKEPSTGVGFDPIRKWGKFKMRCIGTCLREKGPFDVYAGCFYVDLAQGKAKLLEFLATPAAGGAYKDGKLDTAKLLSNEAFYQWLIKADLPTSIDMTFVRDVSGDKIKGAYKEGLSKFMKDKAMMNKFLDQTTGDIAKWQHLTLNTFPGGKVVFQYAGKTKKTIVSKDLAQGLLSIYFGKPPLKQAIKRSLVKNIHLLLK